MRLFPAIIVVHSSSFISRALAAGLLVLTLHLFDLLDKHPSALLYGKLHERLLLS